MAVEYQVHQPIPHKKQAEIKNSTAKRKVIRAGRRGGKTTLAADISVDYFLAGKRVLYAAPTSEQLNRYWITCTRALQEPIDGGVYKKNETENFIELPGTENRIKAKTAWNADTLRGDYADLLILDEFQLMNEDTWSLVGAPMLLDNNGDAIFIYTPPSLRSRAGTKAKDPQHAAKLFQRAELDTKGRWAAFHFTSYDNPHISEDALSDITEDMNQLSIQMEIMAEDVTETPGALWTRLILEKYRLTKTPELARVVVAVDPSTSTGGMECGIITAGELQNHFVVIGDDSIQGSPETWATAAIAAYHKNRADLIVAEKNQGGEMVELTLHTIDPTVPVKLVSATRGKYVRAEPIAVIFTRGYGHLLGRYPSLEDELCLWTPGDNSPNRLDAMVWAGTELMLNKPKQKKVIYDPVRIG